jgi:hypothetical protein
VTALGQPPDRARERHGQHLGIPSLKCNLDDRDVGYLDLQYLGAVETLVTIGRVNALMVFKSMRDSLSPVADDSGWLLLLLSPLLSAAGPVPRFCGLPADDSVTPWSSPPSPGLLPATRPRPVLSQAPPPNPIAAEPYGRRVLSRGGEADHEVTPKAPLTGSGCREHSYGGFGGGHSPSSRMLLTS